MDWKKIHSILFVPAEKKRLDKIKDLTADAYIIDLEDAIKDSEKDLARKEVRLFLDEAKDRNILLRINPMELEKETEMFGDSMSVNCIVIPKVESVEILQTVRAAFPGRDLMALIETPKGMVNLKEILSGEMVSAIGFGAEDYCVRTRTKKSKEFLIPLQSRLVMYGNAFGVFTYDMVNVEYGNLEKYTDYVTIAKNLGFSGKMAIHPKQVEIINRELKQLDKKRIEAIVEEYAESKEGFIIINGEIYEKPHIERMKKMIEE